MAIAVEVLTSEKVIQVCAIARGSFDEQGTLVGIDESQGCALLDAGLAHVVYWGEGGMPGMIQIRENDPPAIARVLNSS